MTAALLPADPAEDSNLDPPHDKGGSGAPAGGAGEVRRALRWTALLVVVAFVVPVGWSYSRALAAPGTDTVAARSVEWLRDHGFNGAVNRFENFWYSHHPPRRGGVPSAGLPSATPPATAVRPAVQVVPAPPDIAPFATPALPNEGVWQATGRLVEGSPVLWTAFLRPDPVHTSLVTGVAHLDVRRLRAVMYQGYQEPGGTNWADQAPIPVERRATLVAAFNSGFRLQHARGGYFAEGRLVRPLVDGAASLVIKAGGRPTVGEWGRDVTMAPDVVSVRQNLALIVDRGAPVPGLDADVGGRWGFTIGNRLFVWRSGVGVTADGSLVYAAGNGLSVKTLADVMSAAGVVRGMELDINPQWTDFFSYSAPDPTRPEQVDAAKLLPDMQPAPDRYFRPSSRDFIALFAG